MRLKDAGHYIQEDKTAGTLCAIISHKYLGFNSITKFVQDAYAKDTHIRGHSGGACSFFCATVYLHCKRSISLQTCWTGRSKGINTLASRRNRCIDSEPPLRPRHQPCQPTLASTFVLDVARTAWLPPSASSHILGSRQLAAGALSEAIQAYAGQHARRRRRTLTQGRLHTGEQREVLEAGLRILVRMIVRAHLRRHRTPPAAGTTSGRSRSCPKQSSCGLSLQRPFAALGGAYLDDPEGAFRSRGADGMAQSRYAPCHAHGGPRGWGHATPSYQGEAEAFRRHVGVPGSPRILPASLPTDSDGAAQMDKLGRPDWGRPLA